MSEKVQNALKDGPDPASLSQDVRTAIIENIQMGFLDRSLLTDFNNYYRNKENKNLFSVLLEKDSMHISLIQWLANQLYEKGFFNPLKKGRIVLTDTDKRILHKLNTSLISDILEIPEMILNWPLILTFNSDHVISTMEAAGYQFVRSYDNSSIFYFLEFN